MVSSTKLLKAQRILSSLKPYAASLFQMVKDFHRTLNPADFHKIILPAKGKKALIIAIGSNKGLCGTYNVMLIRKTLDHIHALENSGFDVQLFLMGSKISDYFFKKKSKIYDVRNDYIDKVNFQFASELGKQLIELISEGVFDRVDVVYSRFRHALIQEIVAEQLLPLTSLPKQAIQESKAHVSNTQEEHMKIIMEPGSKEISDYLVPRYFITLTFQLLLSAVASEHGARMTAMQKSTDNASELLKNLSLSLNKLRQSVITREILEIVSGAESM